MSLSISSTAATYAGNSDFRFAKTVGLFKDGRADSSTVLVSTFISLILIGESILVALKTFTIGLSSLSNLLLKYSNPGCTDNEAKATNAVH